MLTLLRLFQRREGVREGRRGWATTALRDHAMGVRPAVCEGCNSDWEEVIDLLKVKNFFPEGGSELGDGILLLALSFRCLFERDLLVYTA